MINYQGKKAVEYINDQCWHDSVLYEIRIIRVNSSDQLVLDLNLIVDEEKWISQHTSLTFNECYYIETKMNGGIECMSDGEMISGASATNEAKLIDEVCNKWAKFGLKLQALFQFSMMLASTGSTLQIVCNSIEIDTERKACKHKAPPQIYPTRL